MMTTQEKRRIQEAVAKLQAEIERDKKLGKNVRWKEAYFEKMREAWERALERMER